MPAENPESYYQQLAIKWLEGTLTPEEAREFAAWYNRDQDLPVSIPVSYARCEEEHRKLLLNRIRRRIRLQRRGRVFSLPKVAAAVIILATASLTVYLYRTGTFERHGQAPAIVQDIAPGSDKATLRLENGTELSLDEMENGVVREINGIRIRKEGGQLLYESSGGKPDPPSVVVHNTIKVPRGGQYKLTLPDGSRVWLNAASSLRYPVVFAGKERHVELTGEAYFEVASQPERPFRINVDNRNTVVVTGTSFNISAYRDEPGIETTLLEGAVKVFSPDKKQVEQLRPGQQSRMGADGRLVVREVADLEAVVAWKNGLTLFRDASLQSIMRQVSRWYDVEVVYEGEMEERLFTGGISRQSNLSSLLKILKLNDVHIDLEGNKIIIKP